MSYDREQLETQSLEMIKKHKLKFISHVASFLPCNRATFYNLGLDKLDTIKDAIELNRVNSKVKALNRWEKSENPTLEVAFYKLIGDEDEVERLSGTKQKHELTGKDGSPIEQNHNLKIVDDLLKNYGNDERTDRD
jgi:hypothetical protein